MTLPTLRQREPALAALFSLASAAYAWANTPSRRLVLWDKVPAEQMPALYQFEGHATTYEWAGNTGIPRRTLGVSLFVYLNSRDESQAENMAAIADAMDAALWSPGAVSQYGVQNLGGTCYACRIDGDVILDPGDIDGQGLMIFPIRIILP